jgi:hypothetical protein
MTLAKWFRSYYSTLSRWPHVYGRIDIPDGVEYRWDTTPMPPRRFLATLHFHHAKLEDWFDWYKRTMRFAPSKPWWKI